MSKPITLTVKVKLTIDPDAYAEEYGRFDGLGKRETVAEIKEDARNHFTPYIEDLVTTIGGLSYLYTAEVTS